MTHDPLLLSNLKPYIGSLHIYNADGNTLLIMVVGNVSLDLPNVLVFHNLSTNLICIDQLVNNDYTVSFLLLVVLCRIKCPR